jgi:ribonuclease Z
MLLRSSTLLLSTNRIYRVKVFSRCLSVEPNAMNWSTSVLTSVSSDTEPTIVLTFDSGKYVFNAGENTTRALTQSRQNFKKTKGLFFTSVGTQRMSGITGKFILI